MKLSIVGSGLAGLASTHVAVEAGFEVRVYSFQNSASEISSGFLHPYGGTRGKVNRFGKEGMEESLKLIGEKETGILRLGVTEELRKNFNDLSLREPKVHYLFKEEVVERNPGVAPLDGIWIEEALIVNIQKYTSSLKAKLIEKGVEFIREKVEEETWGEQVIWATGAYTPFIGKVKGQTLLIKMKNHGINDPINAHCYIIPKSEGFLVGATFERDQTDWETDIERAKELLFPKLKEILPTFHEGSVEAIECRTGVRATTPDHLPLIKQIDQRNWIYTGLGSKGLLYHALFAKKLISMIYQT